MVAIFTESVSGVDVKLLDFCVVRAISILRSGLLKIRADKVTTTPGSFVGPGDCKRQVAAVVGESLNRNDRQTNAPHGYPMRSVDFSFKPQA